MLKVTVAAVGRLRPGPERTLFDDYARRFERAGRQLGFGPLNLAEVEARKGGPAAEAALLSGAVPEGAVRVPLDERGRTLASPVFAARLADWRDAGHGTVAFLIGGADGLDPALAAAGEPLSFGPMVWPHMLARVMLAEQLYRAASILSGAPYHRA